MQKKLLKSILSAWISDHRDYSYM